MYDAAWERAAVGRTKIWLKPFGRLAPTRKSLPNLASTKAVGQRDSHAWMRDPGARTGGRPMPLTEILVTNSSYTSSGRLRGRLIRAGLKEARCEVCGLTEWRGESIQLELDHIDGNRSNNSLPNLRMLCPNCHAQTETWCKQKPT
jgi:hypothetical protein